MQLDRDRKRHHRGTVPAMESCSRHDIVCSHEGLLRLRLCYWTGGPHHHRRHFLWDKYGHRKHNSDSH